MHAARDQSGEMRHVDHQDRADFIRDRAEFGEVDRAGIRRTARDDQFGSAFFRQPFDLVEIDASVFLAHAVLHRVEPFAGQRRRGAVRQMPARGQGHAHQRVPRLQQSQLNRAVRLRAGMRLDVDEFRAEQLFRARDRQIFGDVDKLAPAVVASAAVPFGVFVGQNRSLRLQNGFGHDVFRRDQFDLVLLTAQFLDDAIVNFGIGVL